MPAYYWIQLYKPISEVDVSTIVRNTVESMVDAGCKYRYSQILNIENDSLPREKQRLNTNNVECNLTDAIFYAINDLTSWLTIGKAKKWLPGITIIFEFDFQFDEDVARRLNTDQARNVKQLKLDFWVREDRLFGEKIVISLDTWEEYVLMYGQESTHNENKNQIIKIVNNISNSITPYYGWLDNELNSRDEQYELIGKANWCVRNEFVLIGPQIIDKVVINEADIVSILDNGCLLVRRHINS